MTKPKRIIIVGHMGSGKSLLARLSNICSVNSVLLPVALIKTQTDLSFFTKTQLI